MKGAVKIMAWTKVKIAGAVGVGVLLAAGTTAVVVRQAARHREDAIWARITKADRAHLNFAPPVVSIRPAQLGRGFGTAWISDGRKQMAFNKSVGKLLQNAYRVRESRIVYPGKLPEGTYDYIVSVPDHQVEALQAAIKQKFGLVAKKEIREVDVLLLRVARTDPPGFRPTKWAQLANLNNTEPGKFEIRNETFDNVTFSMEAFLRMPLINETGMSGRFDAELTWDASGEDGNPEGLKQAIRDQLGFDLVPDRRTIEVLTVKKVR